MICKCVQETMTRGGGMSLFTILPILCGYTLYIFKYIMCAHINVYTNVCETMRRGGGMPLFTILPPLSFFLQQHEPIFVI